MENTKSQRSKEWYNERFGRFTASRISELLGAKGLGLTGENYAFEKAVEKLFGKDEEDSFVSFDMQRGINLEPLAFKKFQELKAINFIEVKNSYFFPYGEDAGASPDGIVGSDAILEIKCPRVNKFFNLVAQGEKAIDKNYYYQIQMQMLCSNSKQAHFFNYLIFNNKEFHHEIIIQRNDEIIELIKERLIIAIELRNEFMNYIISNQQC